MRRRSKCNDHEYDPGGTAAKTIDITEYLYKEGRSEDSDSYSGHRLGTDSRY